MKKQDSLNSECCIEERDGKHLTFWVEGQLLGIPVKDVVQIIGMQEIVGIPECPAYVRGLVCLRGEIFPVMDVRLRLGRSEVAYNERTCIIVTRIGKDSFGLIVDGVDEVRDIPEEAITPLSRIRASWDSPCLTGIARLVTGQSGKENLILIVNMTKLAGEDGFLMSAHAVKGELQYV